MICFGTLLIDFMLVDLPDKLQPICRLNVLDYVAKGAKGYLDNLAKELITALHLRGQAVISRNLGDVLIA
jgi:hypothetical protein